MRPIRDRGRLARLVALLMALGLVAAACGGDDDESADRDTLEEDAEQPVEGEAAMGGTLIDLQNFAGGEPAHIDPGLAYTIQSAQIPQLVFDGLTDNDYETGEVVPMVAESWDSNEAGDEWTFELRDDVTWHDGSPVLPSDFKFAWERVASPAFASEIAYHLDVIEGKEAMDSGTATELSGVVADDEAMTLTVQLNAPYSSFPAAVSHTVFSPVPRAIVEALPDPSQWEQGVMVGNGPFQMAEPWAHEQSITLGRYDGYYGGSATGGTAYLDRIEFRISADIETAFQSFEAGQGQTGRIPPGRWEEVISRYEGQTTTEPSLGIYYFGFNMADPAVGGDENLPLRQAIALAVDKQAINDTVYSGSRTIATGFTPPGVPGYEEGLGGEFAGATERDVERAEELLEEWGGELTAPILLNFNAGSGHEPVATIIQDNLRDVGIEAELDPRDSTTYFTQMRNAEGQFFRAGWIWDYVAYDNGMYPLFHSDTIGGDNLMQYSNAEFDALVTEARATPDPEESQELYAQAEQVMLEDVAVVPLNWYNGQIVYADNVRNFVQSPLQYVAYEDVWLEQ